ncbi:transposable element Tcb1 transposase [Trichonephila clavipes]|nr:transposable element Tcb1 transposase [Trichonephila clavipes]
MSRRKQRSAFDQVSDFNRERIVAHRDCGLPFREIGRRVGRNQATVMWICDRWMQAGTTDQRGRAHPPQCTTSHQLCQRVEAAWSAVPQEHVQSIFESMLRRVAAVISNSGGYSGY